MGGLREQAPYEKAARRSRTEPLENLVGMSHGADTEVAQAHWSCVNFIRQCKAIVQEAR